MIAHTYFFLSPFRMLTAYCRPQSASLSPSLKCSAEQSSGAESCTLSSCSSPRSSPVYGSCDSKSPSLESASQSTGRNSLNHVVSSEGRHQKNQLWADNSQNNLKYPPHRADLPTTTNLHRQSHPHAGPNPVPYTQPRSSAQPWSPVERSDSSSPPSLKVRGSFRPLELGTRIFTSSSRGPSCSVP